MGIPFKKRKRTADAAGSGFRWKSNNFMIAEFDALYLHFYIYTVRPCDKQFL